MGYRCVCDQGSNLGQPARRNRPGAETLRCTDTKAKVRERGTERDAPRQNKEQTGKGDSSEKKIKEPWLGGSVR